MNLVKNQDHLNKNLQNVAGSITSKHIAVTKICNLIYKSPEKFVSPKKKRILRKQYTRKSVSTIQEKLSPLLNKSAKTTTSSTPPAAALSPTFESTKLKNLQIDFQNKKLERDKTIEELHLYLDENINKLNTNIEITDQNTNIEPLNLSIPNSEYQLNNKILQKTYSKMSGNTTIRSKSTLTERSDGKSTTRNKRKSLIPDVTKNSSSPSKEEIKKRLAELRKNSLKILANNIKKVKMRENLTNTVTPKKPIDELLISPDKKKHSDENIEQQKPDNIKSATIKDIPIVDTNPNKLHLKNRLNPNKKKIGILRRTIDLDDNPSLDTAAVSVSATPSTKLSHQLKTDSVQELINNKQKKMKQLCTVNKEPISSLPSTKTTLNPLQLPSATNTSLKLTENYIIDENELNLIVPDVNLTFNSINIKEQFKSTNIPDNNNLCQDNIQFDKNDISFWLKPTPVHQYPYNFMTALRKKLDAITNPVSKSTDFYDHQQIEKFKVNANTQQNQSSNHSIEIPQQEINSCQYSQQYEKQVNENISKKIKPSTGSSELMTNFSSVTIQLPESNTISDISSIASDTNIEMKFHNNNNNNIGKNGNDMNSTPLSSDCIEQKSSQLIYNEPNTDNINALSVDKLISNFNRKTKSKRKPFKQPDTSFITFKRDYTVENDINQLPLLPAPQSIAPLIKKSQTIEELLNDFNTTLSHAINCNKQLHMAINNSTTKIQPPINTTASVNITKNQSIQTSPTHLNNYKSSVSIETNPKISSDGGFKYSTDSFITNNTSIIDQQQNTINSEKIITTAHLSIPESINSILNNTTTDSNTLETINETYHSGKKVHAKQQTINDNNKINSSTNSSSILSIIESENLPNSISLDTKKNSDEEMIATELTGETNNNEIIVNVNESITEYPNDEKNLRNVSCQESSANKLINQSGNSDIISLINHRAHDPRSSSSFDSKSIINSSIGSDIYAFFNQTTTDLDISISTINHNSTIVSDDNLSYSNIGLFEQLIQKETLKTDHLTRLIKLREKSLIDRTKGQIAWLELQKQKYKKQGLTTQISTLKKKQRSLLIQMEKERNNIRRMIKCYESDDPGVTTNNHRCKFQLNANINLNKTSNRPIDLNATTRTTTTTITKVKAIRGFEIESGRNLERMLKKREDELCKRRKHVEFLIQWHKQLDDEEREILDMEQCLMSTIRNIPDHHNYELFNNKENLPTKSTISQYNQNHQSFIPNDIPSSRSINKDSINVVTSPEKLQQKIKQIDKSLNILQNISARSETDANQFDVVTVNGKRLNKLWHRLTGNLFTGDDNYIQKFHSSIDYHLTKSDLERIYEEAKIIVLDKFNNDTKQLMNKLLDQSSVLIDRNTTDEDKLNESLIHQQSLDISNKTFITKPNDSLSSSTTNTSIIYHHTGDDPIASSNNQILDQISESAAGIDADESNVKLNIQDNQEIPSEEIIESILTITSDNINLDLLPNYIIDSSISSDYPISQQLQQRAPTNASIILTEENVDDIHKSIIINSINNSDGYDNNNLTPEINNEYIDKYLSDDFENNSSEDNGLSEISKIIVTENHTNSIGNISCSSSSSSIDRSTVVISISNSNSTSHSNDNHLLSNFVINKDQQKQQQPQQEEQQENVSITISENISDSDNIEESIILTNSTELEKRLIDIDDSLKDLNETFEKVSIIMDISKTGTNREINNNSENDTTATTIITATNIEENDNTIINCNKKSSVTDGTVGQDIQKNSSDIVQSNSTVNQTNHSLLDTKTEPIVLLKPLEYLNLESSATTTTTVTSHSPVSDNEVRKHSEMPDIISEAELLRRQQLQIEREIKDLEESIPFVLLREIPNKPPPPYVAPAHGSPMTIIFPSVERIEEIVSRRVSEIYFENYTNDIVVLPNSTTDHSPTISLIDESKSILSENITNVYERIILDICKEIMCELIEQQQQQKQRYNESYYQQMIKLESFKYPLAFYNPPNRLKCFQEYILKRVKMFLRITTSMNHENNGYCGTGGGDDEVEYGRSNYTRNDNNSFNYLYGISRKKHDTVDDILIREIFEEDGKWTNYDLESEEVVNNLTDNIMSIMIDNAVNQVQITLKNKCGV